MLFIEATVGANIFHSFSIKAKLSSHLIDLNEKWSLCNNMSNDLFSVMFTLSQRVCY